MDYGNKTRFYHNFLFGKTPKKIDKSIKACVTQKN